MDNFSFFFSLVCRDFDQLKKPPWIGRSTNDHIQYELISSLVLFGLCIHCQWNLFFIHATDVYILISFTWYDEKGEIRQNWVKSSRFNTKWKQSDFSSEMSGNSSSTTMYNIYRYKRNGNKNISIDRWRKFQFDRSVYCTCFWVRDSCLVGKASWK